MAALLPCLAALICTVAGCTGAKQSQQQDEIGTAPITLSGEQLHSPSGDMTARVPNDWVTLDPAQLESPQVFGMTCNPEYTISVVFSETPVDKAAQGIFSRDGLRGLVDASFQRHRKRSNGRALLHGEIEEFAIGRRQFAAYAYSTDSSVTMTRVAVFFTNAHLYECAITQLPFSGHELPSMKLMRTIHQIILGSIEW